jgi:hypothetical protein
MPDLHGNVGQSFPDLADPSVTAQRSEGVGPIASYRDSAVTSIACAISSMSWITTVQVLRATMAIYHIRYLFSYRDLEKVEGDEETQSPRRAGMHFRPGGRGRASIGGNERANSVGWNTFYRARPACSICSNL